MTSLPLLHDPLHSGPTPDDLSIGRKPLLRCGARPVVRFVRYGIISAVIGLGVTLVLNLNDPNPFNTWNFVGGVMMGLTIGLGSLLMEMVALRPLLTLGLKPIFLARCFCYFMGGLVGYWVGLAFNVWVLGIQEFATSLLDHPGRSLQSMVIYGAIAVAVGITFHTVESLRSSLAEKVSELKTKEFAERELETARLIQKRLMPPEKAEGPGFQLAAQNRAASFVAGDFYDYFHLPDGTMGFAIADVAGKGIGASLQMATVKAVLPLVAAQRVASDNPVAGTLDDLNERLCDELGPREFVALLYGRFDPRGRTVELANAGLPDPYWISEADACAPRVKALSVEGERLPLGVRTGTHYGSLTLPAAEPGTMLLLTDGMVERRIAGSDEPLGYERFEQILAQMEPADDVSLWLGQLQERLNRESAHAPEDDDCTTMAIRCDPEQCGNSAFEGSGILESAEEQSTTAMAV